MATTTRHELGVLESIQPVIAGSRYVHVDESAVSTLAPGLAHRIQPPAWHTNLHWTSGTPNQIANWLLVLDALNFSFWGRSAATAAEKPVRRVPLESPPGSEAATAAEKPARRVPPESPAGSEAATAAEKPARRAPPESPAGSEPRWRVEHNGEKLDGYFALAASLTRAVEQDDRPLWDARYLSNLTLDDLADILRGENTIPMLDRRLENLHEVGEVLQSRFDGQFSTAIQMSGRSGVLLTRLLARDFLSFDDIADFKGGGVRFYKRAQLLVSDLHGAFGGQSWGRFDDLDQLTAFADYKLPQILRHMGVLTYLPSLAEKVDNRFLLPPHSREEVEIRANTVWAVELLRQALEQNGASLMAYQLDGWLWHESQRWSGMAPYHLCRTVYY